MAASPRRPHHASDRLVACYPAGEGLRSRSVSERVLTTRLAVPAPPPRLWADWQRETALHLRLEPGDVEALPLARARARWPDFRRCAEAVSGWTRTLGLHAPLADCDVALMACRGARYHHDAAQYGGAVFCNLFLSEDCGLDVHFPVTGDRIPLVRGTAMVFDTGQPHAVIPRGRSRGFDAADFGPGAQGLQVFLTWELPVENAAVAGALGIAFDVDPALASRHDEAQLWRNGARAALCADSGRWRRAEGGAG